MSSKRKMTFHVKQKSKETAAPATIPADNYLKAGKAHCPECGKADLEVTSHYFANPPGALLPNQVEDRLLKLEIRCRSCAAAFTEVNEKQFKESSDEDGKRDGVKTDKPKHCPFCSKDNILFDSAAIHFKGDDRYAQKVFCIDCKRHHLEWSTYTFLKLEEWDGVSHYQKLYDSLQKRQEHLALQLHRRGQPLHTSEAFQINQQLMDRIKETRLENPPKYDTLPDRFGDGL